MCQPSVLVGFFFQTPLVGTLEVVAKITQKEDSATRQASIDIITRIPTGSEANDPFYLEAMQLLPQHDWEKSEIGGEGVKSSQLCVDAMKHKTTPPRNPLDSLGIGPPPSSAGPSDLSLKDARSTSPFFPSPLSFNIYI